MAEAFPWVEVTGPEIIIACPDFARAYAGELAWVRAATAYDLEHGLYTPPFWDRRERKKLCKRAMKQARLEFIKNGTLPHG